MKRGFTLIELLVVIAIIAILAAILFPVFSRARAKAQQTSCLSNEKQLALGIQMYASDYDNTMIPWGIGPTDSAGNNGVAQGFYSWDTIIQPYVKNTQILVCPSNPYNGAFRGYALARYAVSQPEASRNLVVTQDLISAPASTILLFDKGAHAVGQCGDAAAENPIQSHGCTGSDLKTDMFHNGGKNFAYVDGHAKWAMQGAGPFIAFNASATDPTGGYEAHVPGHCEFNTDLPKR
jgi:prepilin-type N-terminal cleavage/methylation domain-containing protein/prepilin-type processing-associated H-X9-DG protein